MTVAKQAARNNNHAGLFFISFELRIFIKEFATKEKFEIVSGAALPPFRFSEETFFATTNSESGSG